MNDEQPKRVVRRVVTKKTVVRPVGDAGREAGTPRPSTPPSAPSPRPRTVTNPHTGRTVTIGAGKSAPVKPGPVKTPRRPEDATARTKPEPVVPRRRGRDVLDDWRLGLSERRAGAVEAVRRGGATVGRGARSLGATVLGLRLPHWPDLRAVAAAAVVTGVVLVGLGWATLELFDRIFGVKSGGAWGVVAFAALAVAGYAVTRLLLGWFGHPAAGVIAGLAQLIGVVLLLVFLPTDAQSRWSLLIVPVVSLVAHLLAAGAARLAEDEDVVDDTARHSAAPVSIS